MPTAGLDAGNASLAQPPERSRILRFIHRRFFSHIGVDERWSRTVRDAAQRGTVVYVMRSISVLDFLCLDYLIRRLGLPLLRFVNDLGLWILEPFGRGDARLRFRRTIPEDKALGTAVSGGDSALLFLRRGPTITNPKRKGQTLEVDLIRTLVEVQRKLSRPILLVPQTFVWSILPPNKRWSIFDIVFGPIDSPGRLRVLVQFLVNYRNARLRSGDPFDVQAFLAANQELTDIQAADKIRYAMLRRIERERTVVLGPHAKVPQRIREEILRSPRIRDAIAQAARASDRSPTAVTKEATRELRKLMSAPDAPTIAVVRWVLQKVWNRIYSGLIVDLPGIERVRAAMEKGNLVFLPSHKSHIDYLVISDVLYTHSLSPPLIAAGENLSFWPLGAILRLCGAFFIRRSFRGKRLYTALVDAYIRKIMLEGFNVEFFLEGGRSRTGKLLPPKYGLLSMVVDAALSLQRRPVFFVPVSVGYERIIEQKAYAQELGGKEKKAENLGGLLQSTQVLRARYGRLYIQFGEIVPLADVVRDVAGISDTKAPMPRDLSQPQRRALVQKIAHRVSYEIDRATVATPAAVTATALLSHRRRGVPQRDLLAHTSKIVDALRERGATLATTLLDANGAVRPEVLAETVKLFEDGRLVTTHGEGEDAIHQVPEERRVALEYYKNNVLHFFVPSALISAAIRSSGDEPIAIGRLRERVQRLSRVFKYEFMYRADATFEEIFDDALNVMLRAGEVERMADHLRAGSGRAIELYASLLRTYFEGYRVALRAMEPLFTESMPRKEWLKRALAVGERMYLSGEIEQRESVSRPKLENAILSMRDHDIMSVTDDVLSPGGAARTIETIKQLESRLARYED